MKLPFSFFLCLAVFAVFAVSLFVAGCANTRPVPAPTEPVAVSPAAPVEICPVVMTPEPEPAWQSVAGKTVIIDAGHGGDDHGASHYGMREKDINLDLARRTAALLRANGINVLMTRDDDRFIPLAERSAFANRSPNAVFVSIHVNASETNPNATGIETFVLSGAVSDAERGAIAASKYKVASSDPVQGKQALATLAAKSRNRAPLLADTVQKNMATRMGAVNRGVKKGNLAVLRETYFCPAVLVEVGFLTNPSTAAAMRADEWRRRTSAALSEGICEYLRQPE